MRFKVLNLDGVPDSSGDIIDPDGVDLAFDQVPVSLNFSTEIRDQIGVALLERVGDAVYAEFEIQGGWKLDEASVVLLTPAVCGVTFEREGNTIKKCLIKSLGLSITPNADRRIKSIKEQLATQPR